jgi:hypothetical protein
LKIQLGLALILASVPGAFGSLIPLTPANVIGFLGAYPGPFPASSILDHQTGTITEPAQDGSYWLNSDNGPANAYIVIDLGAGFQLASFDLFNTHNANFGDRGTGSFSIQASNSIAPGVGSSSGSDLSGTIVTLVSGTLLAANPSPLSGPLVAQTFLSSNSGTFRYIRFSPQSVASFNALLRNQRLWPERTARLRYREHGSGTGDYGSFGCRSRSPRLASQTNRITRLGAPRR